MQSILGWFLHLDVHLAELVASHGALVYLMLFAVIFIETGVVILPFLPGDSLLFVAGALCARGAFEPWILFPLLAVAAIAGDTLNFAIGSYLRKRAIDPGRVPLLKPEHVRITHAFFERHGGKTILLARFVPIVRTLAPFVAALGTMPYHTFVAYNVAGGLIWTGSLIAAGYVFGTIPWVSANLTAVIMGIVVLSILPGVIGWLRSRGAAGASGAR
jgi:membrane-associated protein